MDLENNRYKMGSLKLDTFLSLWETVIAKNPKEVLFNGFNGIERS